MMQRAASLDFRAWILALVLAACPACSGRHPVLYPVHGKVFFDGRPAPGARVVFHPTGASDPTIPKPSATVRGDGTFSLGTYASEDGAPPGSYRVAIVWLAATPTGSQKADVPNRLPARYGNPQTSQLFAEIKDGPTELEPFKLVK